MKNQLNYNNILGPDDIKQLNSNETGNNQTQTQSYTTGYTYTQQVFSYFDCYNVLTMQTFKSAKKTKLQIELDKFF